MVPRLRRRFFVDMIDIRNVAFRELESKNFNRRGSSNSRSRDSDKKSIIRYADTF